MAFRIMKRWVSIAAVGLCTAGLVFASASPAAAWREPDAKGLANPGVTQRPDGRWVVHSTGSIAGHRVGLSKTTRPGGSYGVSKRQLLDKRPSWVPKNAQGVWAPSVVRSATGQYVVFYAARVKGTKSARCIGTGFGPKPEGPFQHSERALACWKKSGTNPWDKIKSEGAGFSLIDPTPAWVQGRLVLTYKTGKKTKGRWHTTTRMVELDPDDPTRTRADGHRNSIKLTDWRNKYIEENPVLVEHGGTLTLFTSRGWYGTCRYSTVYRQNKSLWTGWMKKKPKALRFATKPNTCGTGNGQVVQQAGTGRWLYFFNGHTKKSTPGGPKGLYVGELTWSNGRPRVAKLL
ncbi:MAG: family 43 glycosylhydrolase [Microlunatus sp.]